VKVRKKQGFQHPKPHFCAFLTLNAIGKSGFVSGNLSFRNRTSDIFAISPRFLRNPGAKRPGPASLRFVR
jgi:hypothetical protein